MERGGSCFGFVVVETVCIVFISVVGPQVEVGDDLHLLRKCLKQISLEESIFDRLDGVEIELGPEMIEHIVS